MWAFCQAITACTLGRHGSRLTGVVEIAHSNLELRSSQESVNDVLKKALRGEETANYELPLMTKDGQRLLLLVNATTRRNQIGDAHPRNLLLFEALGDGRYSVSNTEDSFSGTISARMRTADDTTSDTASN